MGGRNPGFYLGHVHVGMTKYQTSTPEKEMQLFKTLLSKSKSLRLSENKIQIHAAFLRHNENQMILKN